MTRAELQEALNEYPPDMEVYNIVDKTAMSVDSVKAYFFHSEEDGLAAYESEFLAKLFQVNTDELKLGIALL